MNPDKRRTARSATIPFVAETHQITSDPGKTLRTNQGIPIADNQNSLKAGERGPALLEDFVLHEKIAHFDQERIPECIVHARGSGAHGFLQSYEFCRQLHDGGLPSRA